MATITKKRKISGEDDLNYPIKRTKSSRDDRRKASRIRPTRAQSPQHRMASSSPESSPSPDPIHHFFAPPRPEPTRWMCARCKSRDAYPIGTQRCLKCGRRICLQSRKKADVPSLVSYDAIGWEKWLKWWRWQLVIGKASLSAGWEELIATPTSVAVPNHLVDRVNDQLEKMEEDRIVRLVTGEHSCFEDCNWPVNCRMYLPTPSASSCQTSDEENEEPSPVIPDSPRSPPPSDDEDEENLEWVDVDAEVGRDPDFM